LRLGRMTRVCLSRMGLRARRQKLLLLRHKYDVGKNEDQRDTRN
jgi:hypothetical protein